MRSPMLLLLRLAVSFCLSILAGCTAEVDEAYSRGIDAYANKQYEEAAPLIKRAAEANHLDGMTILGVMYLYGNGVEKDGVEPKRGCRVPPRLAK